MSPDNQRKGLKDAVEVLIKYLDHKVFDVFQFDFHCAAPLRLIKILK